MPSSQRCFLFTFDFEVVSSKAVGLEVEGQRCVGLVQEQVDPGQLDAVPLEHRVENLAGDAQTKPPAVKCGFGDSCGGAGAAAPPPDPHPKVFFFIAGTISVLMSTLRSNLRLKHSLLGSCAGGGQKIKTALSLHRWGQQSGVKNICRLSDTITLHHN